MRFADRGEALLHDSYEVKREVETEYAAELGGERLESLREALSRLTTLHE